MTNIDITLKANKWWWCDGRFCAGNLTMFLSISNLMSRDDEGLTDTGWNVFPCELSAIEQASSENIYSLR